MKVNRSSSCLVPGVLLAALLLSACGGPERVTEGPALPSPATAAPQPTVSSEPAPTPTPQPAAGPISGLTGLPASDKVLTRPLAVMINNAPAARPQSGISEADILYEVLAEGGITRLIGIFQSQTGVVKIGPIRSIRPYLIDIGESHGGITVHAGGSPAAYAILQRQKKADLDEIGRAGAYFWRDKTRKAPHNLYSNAAKLQEGAEKFGYAKDKAVPGYRFGNPDQAPAGGQAADSFNVRFLLKSYEVGYKYDAEQRIYLREVNGKAHLDLNNSKPVAASNVIVMGADHKTLDDVGRLAVDVELGGKALLFQRGKMFEGKWTRKPNDVIRFVKDGEEAALYPGTTHILIVPNAPSFDSHITFTSPKSAT